MLALGAGVWAGAESETASGPAAAPVLPVSSVEPLKPPATAAPDPWRPPAPPAHAKRELETASDLAADLQQVVRFLEEGQAYYRAFQKGSHSVEENKRFLRFLESYEAEAAVAKKEVDALRKWVHERGGLEQGAR
ncbi:MAG: hypothetical protein A2X36_12675 [Elusimicrobia bacterium GWA2_69_24]|nr:MAG: hypothetical protein A2X36_12675 [Elusimicrobia bacterium GWA2_69_24]HBL17454.1 hypothetical protein [Elusimicrobiota bacterium]